MSDEIDSLLQLLDCLELSENSIKKSIDKVRIIIEAGDRNINRTENSEIIIIFGTTGCGKSTILNWLAGCTMEWNEEDEVIAVLPFDRDGNRDEIFPIGSEHIESKTIVPCIYPLTDTIIVCDSPGFVDSRGSEFSIANAVNMMSILKSCGNLGILLLFNVHEILGLRGDGAKESLQTFVKMLGGIESVNKYSNNITIAINHASRTQHKKALKIFLDICFQIGWQRITEDKISFLDPLEKEGNISKSDFLSKLIKMPRICRHDKFNLAPLAPKDILLINAIADELYISCEKNWETKDINSIIANYNLLNSLLIIGFQPILLTAINSIQKLIISNVQIFIETNIFNIRLNHNNNDSNKNTDTNNNNNNNDNKSNSNNNNDNNDYSIGNDYHSIFFYNINFLKSLSALDVCFTSTVTLPQESKSEETSSPLHETCIHTNTISTLIDNTLLKLKEIEVTELQQSFDYFNSNSIHILNKLSQQLATLAYDQPQLLSTLDSNKIGLFTLKENLPYLNDILVFLNKIKQDANNYQFYYYGNQLNELFHMLQNDVESSIINIITAQIISAQCELLVAKAIQSITKLTTQAESLIAATNTLYSNILEIELVYKSDEIELKLNKLIESPSLFNKSELQQLLEVLVILKNYSLKNKNYEVIVRKYHIICNKIQYFWSKLVSLSTRIIVDKIHKLLSEIQLQFSVATVLIRYLITPFNLTSLAVFPLLMQPCQNLSTILVQLSGCDKELYQEMMNTIDHILLKLQYTQMKSVCCNLSKNIEINLAEYLINMRSDECGVLLLTPLNNLFNICEDAYNDVIVKMIMTCRTALTNEVSNIIQQPLSEYRKACLRFEQRAEKTKLLFSILKVPIDTGILSTTISTAKQTLREYERDFLQVTKNDLIADSNNILELIALALDKYIQLETSSISDEFRKCSLLQSNTMIQTLRASHCLTKDVTAVIEELRKKAAQVERAVVFNDMGNVRLLELIGDLKMNIISAMQSANTELTAREMVQQFKRHFSKLREIIEKVVELNPSFFCKKDNDLTLDYLFQSNLKLAQTIIRELKEMREQDKTIEETKISDYLGAVQKRASLLYSFQLANQIDGWCVSNTVSDNIEQLKVAFNTLNRLGTHCYNDKKASLAVYCDSLQDIGSIQTAIKAKNFTHVFFRRSVLLKLKESIPNYVNITVERIDGIISDFMNTMFDNVIEEIERSVAIDNFLEFSQLREFMEVCRGLRELTENHINILNQKAVEIFELLFDENRINELTTMTSTLSADLENIKLRDFTKRFVKYFAVARELDLLKDFTDRMGRLLAEIPAPVTDALSRHISELQGINSLAVVCGEIFDAFKVFSRINIAKFNRIAGQVSFESALATVNTNPLCKKSVLMGAYCIFISTYDQIISDIVQKRYDYSIQMEQIQEVCLRIGSDYDNLFKHVEDTAKLIAYVCGQYSYVDAKETYFSGVKDSLLQVHSTQILSIFLLLGIDQKGGATGQLNQILTGEGKSITLAIVAAVYALLDISTTIICFSSYLTLKDEKLFEKFYESLDISDYIGYNTIYDVGDTVMDELLPDIRSQVISYLKGEIVAPFVPETETGVLLIDEVDVFFGENIYGKLYHPVNKIVSKPAHDLMMFMWNNRKILNNMSVTSADSFVRTSQNRQINLLVREFPRIFPLLPPIIRECCQVLRLYHSKPGISEFKCFIKDDKIADIEPTSGATVYYSGHSIMFEYCFQHEQLQSDGKPFISDKSLLENVGLTISCGSILYAELPKRFQLVHGVTGTLTSFQKEQNKILNNYGFKRKSFIPTTFQKYPPVVTPTTVITGTRNGDYFDRIKAVLQNMLRKHRATLVFFETYELLESFRKELIKKPITLPNYRTPEILSEKLSPNVRDGVISRAINTCKITLCTKLYMRGTDFICRDTQLVKNGGVHILLTFYPETETDQIQARGRTCRQNDPGSFQMVLFAQDLVDKGLLRSRLENRQHIPDLSEADEIKLGESVKEIDRWDEFLKRKREASVVKISKQIFSTLSKNTLNHEKTLEMSRCMENGDLQALVYLTGFQGKSDIDDS